LDINKEIKNKNYFVDDSSEGKSMNINLPNFDLLKDKSKKTKIPYK
jgi:hypothetical protein